MAPKHHPTPLSGGDRKALNKELGKARAMVLAARSAEMRAKGEALIQQADRMLCESWNERMWSDGDRSVTNDRPGRQRRLSLAGDPVRTVQDAERRRPRGDEAPADHPRARPRQPAALPQVRQSRPTSRCDLATVGLAAAPSSNRSLTDVQSLLDHDKPGRHHRAISCREPIRRQPRSDARRVSRLQGADRAQRSRGPRTRHGGGERHRRSTP
jgi:hypothetical protein